MRICVYCEEPIVAGDYLDPNFQQPMHFECGFRSVAGSLAHLAHRCSCFVTGSSEGDPPWMTKREAARAVLEAYRKLNPVEWEHEA